jgi:hypothetical protein
MAGHFYCKHCGGDITDRSHKHVCLKYEELIPQAAIDSLHARFEKGQVTYAHDCWDASSNNQDQLDNDKWVIERALHALKHVKLVIAKIHNPQMDDGDDDAGAIMWFGAMLAARRARRKEMQQK